MRGWFTKLGDVRFLRNLVPPSESPTASRDADESTCATLEAPNNMIAPIDAPSTCYRPSAPLSVQLLQCFSSPLWLRSSQTLPGASTFNE